jgi:hypothetical protein
MTKIWFQWSGTKTCDFSIHIHGALAARKAVAEGTFGSMPTTEYFPAYITQQKRFCDLWRQKDSRYGLEEEISLLTPIGLNLLAGTPARTDTIAEAYFRSR